MQKDDLRARTKNFALRIIRLVSALPNNRASNVLGRQLLKAGTSIGANYREALRASSRKHFISILEIALREADESLYWLELLSESEIIAKSKIENLMKENDELVAILVATVRTTKQNKNDTVIGKKPK